MSKPLILVTGANGQLGWCLQNKAAEYNQFEFLFVGREQLDLANKDTIQHFLFEYKPSFIINCAAYTAVDKAETDMENALKINAIAVGEMAKYCAATNAVFVTISTDYVFDGNGTKPYMVTEATNPVNYYGYTKWLGEKLSLENNSNSIIIRTSWVYCEHGNNFVKTMLRLMKEKTEINVVNDQIGCPTYAPSLADAILKIICQLPEKKYRGIYHFSNTGNISWFNFATAIKEIAALNCTIHPVATTTFPTPAKRPAYSCMNTSKIEKDFSIEITNWQTALTKCINNLEIT